mmetsp:Transcript_73344/g.218939  ORF Transcript_73344/g.218939 Transcript_73344/m.218939 type:complete len:518 (-) Transcript_73344:147-1700(-)
MPAGGHEVLMEDGDDEEEDSTIPAAGRKRWRTSVLVVAGLVDYGLLVVTFSVCGVIDKDFRLEHKFEDSLSMTVLVELVLTLPLLIQPLGLYAMARSAARRRYQVLDVIYDTFEIAVLGTVFTDLGERRGSVILWGFNLLSSAVDMLLVKSVDFFRSEEFQRDWPHMADVVSTLDFTDDLQDFAEEYLADGEEEEAGAVATWRDWLAVVAVSALLLSSSAYVISTTPSITTTTTATTTVLTSALRPRPMPEAAPAPTPLAAAVTTRTLTLATTTNVAPTTTTSMMPTTLVATEGVALGTTPTPTARDSEQRSDCRARDSDDWPLSKRLWCCRRERRGCPVTIPVLWVYDPPVAYPMHLRSRPDLGAPRLRGELLRPGDVFRISEGRVGDEGVTFLRLADGRGWSFDRLPSVGVLCKPFHGAGGTEPSLALSYGCEVWYPGQQSIWSAAEAEWCCRHRGVGCRDRQEVVDADLPLAPTFSCTILFPGYQKFWSDLQASWCCTYHGIGCRGRERTPDDR